VSYKNILLILSLATASVLPTLSYSEVDNSFLMNEIALRSAKSGLSGSSSGFTGTAGSSSGKSSIVDFLKSSNDNFEKATGLNNKTGEGLQNLLKHAICQGIQTVVKLQELTK